ncbi:MAG: hypothetical protein WCG06_05065, partial [Candidatus Omnitrophota bacterium]
MLSVYHNPNINMHPIGRLRPVSLILVVTLLPLMSSVAAFFCTQRYGMGITPDSITYLYAAKCIALGKGFGILTASGEPMLLYTFAPFLSVSLSPLFWLNADLMICLRLFYGLLFILTNLCYGWIVYRMTGRTLYAFLLQIALCLDPSWQSLYV